MSYINKVSVNVVGYNSRRQRFMFTGFLDTHAPIDTVAYVCAVTRLLGATTQSFRRMYSDKKIIEDTIRIEVISNAYATDAKLDSDFNEFLYEEGFEQSLFDSHSICAQDL